MIVDSEMYGFGRVEIFPHVNQCVSTGVVGNAIIQAQLSKIAVSLYLRNFPIWLPPATVESLGALSIK